MRRVRGSGWKLMEYTGELGFNDLYERMKITREEECAPSPGIGLRGSMLAVKRFVMVCTRFAFALMVVVR